MDVWPFVFLSIPTMIVLGLRHGVDIDHITAIDNLVRLHNAIKKSRWIGASFSSGHMTSVLAEMIFIIYLVGGFINLNNLAFWGGIIGAIALGTIAVVNIYSMKKWGKSSSAILASKILSIDIPKMSIKSKEYALKYSYNNEADKLVAVFWQPPSSTQ